MSTDVALPETIVDRFTGELVSAEPATVARLLKRLRDEYRHALNEMVAECEAILLAESERQGTKTLRLGTVEATVTGGSELVWDEQALLRGLRKAGLPEDRLADVVKEMVSYKIDARAAAQLEAANPAYARVVKRCRSRVPKPWRVTVR